MAKLTGKVAVVTGASKGIGAGIAKALAAEGAAVAVNYSSSREGAEKTVAAITAAGGKAVAVGGSVAKEEDVIKLFAEVQEKLGPVTVLVNNAGVFNFAPIHEFKVEDFDWMYGVNVKGLLLATREAVKQMGAAGGSIINIGSVSSEGMNPGASVYSGTKGALNTITQVLAKELGPKKIRVNAVNPGPVRTEGFESLGLADSEMEAQMIAATPLGRVGQPADYGPISVFLASDDASWITGELIKVAGGLRG